MVKVEPKENVDKNLKIRYILGLVFSILLVYFGIDTIYHMVTTFYEHGGSEWQSWHPNTWVFVGGIEFPLILALGLSLVCLVVGPFIAASSFLGWFRRRRIKPMMAVKRELIQLPEIRIEARAIQRLRNENEALKQELMKTKRTPSGKIGFALLLAGALTLSYSFVTSSSTLAFIGLGLTFWGALFLFAKPIRFVKGSLLDSTVISFYTTIDRMIEDLKYEGKGIYIPAYPKEAYLPEHLKGLKEMVIFIPAQDTVMIPTIEELAKKQLLVKNPKGICITPPGSGLVSLFENELTPPGSGLVSFLGLKVDFSKFDLDSLSNSLSKVITENLGLARNFEMTIQNSLVHVRISDSVYKGLYSREHGLKSIHTIGCPLTSAIACALAKTTGKLVTIDKDEVSPDGQTVQVWYHFIEG
jgi:hypothetical protein